MVEQQLHDLAGLAGVASLNRTGAVHNRRFRCRMARLGEHHLQNFSPKNNKAIQPKGLAFDQFTKSRRRALSRQSVAKYAHPC